MIRFRNWRKAKRLNLVIECLNAFQREWVLLCAWFCSRSTNVYQQMPGTFRRVGVNQMSIVIVHDGLQEKVCLVRERFFLLIETFKSDICIYLKMIKLSELNLKISNTCTHWWLYVCFGAKALSWLELWWTLLLQYCIYWEFWVLIWNDRQYCLSVLSVCRHEDAHNVFNCDQGHFLLHHKSMGLHSWQDIDVRTKFL